MAFEGASSSKAMARMVTDNDVFSEDESSPLMLDTVERNEELNLEADERRRIEKDPRKIARRYQLELCEKALKENVIVYLGTGCGKTHIAVLVMYELRHLIMKPKKEICVFLAPTVALVQQQAKVIEVSTDFKVGTFCGNNKQLNSHHDWQKQLKKYEVFVMTPQIFSHSLCHCFIRMDLVALLVFDECHHAQSKSSHPYAEIMKTYYKTDAEKLPRIFGMTASPVMGKVGSSVAKSLNSLEELLHAKVYTIEDTEEIENFVASPAFKVYYYGPVTNNTYDFNRMIIDKLMEVKRKCLLDIREKTEDHEAIQGINKTLNRIHHNTEICLENLGLWGALQAANIMQSYNHLDAEESYSDDSLFNAYLAQAVQVFAAASDMEKVGSVMHPPEELKEPLFSQKLQCLIDILSQFRVQQEMKCIIFVKRIIIARVLSCILDKVESLASWKCDFLLGAHSGSRTTMNLKLEKFLSGELNLLIATKVGEEGLDIQTCCLVIRFDLPEHVASFIQSRGRARMPNSEYALLVDRSNVKELELIKKFREEEDRMKLEISVRTSDETITALEEAVYEVNSSGASISSGCSVALLHRYCAKLPRDEFFTPKPEFDYYDDGGIVCRIIMPSNAPIHEVISVPCQSMEGAKKDACLKATEVLHKLGALSDYLLSEHSYANEQEEDFIPADFDSDEDEESRGELHEMLVPSVLKNSYSVSENLIQLYSYHINLDPTPRDRVYRDFCLFVKRPLPEGVEKMKLELHLAHRRSVMTDLVPKGFVAFDKDEICSAKNYQEMFFKVLLDRYELAEDFVSLGTNEFCWSIPSTFYIMLPILFHDNENTMAVDWEIVQKSLSSPILRTPTSVTVEESLTHHNELLLANACFANNARNKERSPKDNELFLANGCIPKTDIVQSLVYVPQKKVFYFVNAIDYGKNGSSWSEDLTTNHMKVSRAMSNVQLMHPDQPLLELKPLQNSHNLLHNRHSHNSAPQELKEFFDYLPPEICILKILGFSKDIGSTVSLLPSIMHRLENLLVAVELRDRLSSSFPEGVEVSVERILEAITTEKCQERFSLERLEILGDSFLKYAVGRHLFLRHKNLDEGELTSIRSGVVNNNNLRKLALQKKLQVYIRDQPLDPSQFSAPGRPCKHICTEETQKIVHSVVDGGERCSVVRCSRGHHWLRNKSVADVIEAIVGAFLIDGGFTAASAFLTWMGIRVKYEDYDYESIIMASNTYMSLSAELDIPAIQTELNYQFDYKGLLVQAFVHPSYSNHRGGCYQRLEFLGDAALDYIIISYLYSAYPELKPGQLTDFKSVFVNNKAFADVAVRKSLYKYIICNSSSLSTAIKAYVDYQRRASDDFPETSPMCPKVLGDLVESCTGAVLLDTAFNLNSVWRIILALLDPDEIFSDVQLSPVRQLRELCQSLRWNQPKFSSSITGRKFNVKAEIVGRELYKTITVMYPNKKEATRIAAQHLLKMLKDEGYALKSLQEALNSSCKMEPRLIGFDETPVSIPSLVVVGSNNVDLQGPSSSYQTVKAHNHKSRSTGVVLKKTARSLLYEECTKQYWDRPVYSCCEEKGPSHNKLFTFSVVLRC